MKEDESTLFKLSVNTGDKAAEEFILDNQFQRRASSVGQKSVFELPAGLYTVKIRVGSEYQERLVDLSEDKTVNFEPLPFSSPAPLKIDDKKDQSFIKPATSYSAEMSKEANVSIGKGSQIFVFTRSLLAKDVLPPEIDLSIGLTLRTIKDEIIIDFENPGVGAFNSLKAWSTCNVELNPGTYILCLKTAKGINYKQVIVASPSWQTQIFMLCCNYSRETIDIRADLVNSSIFMVPVGVGYNPVVKHHNYEDPDFRLTEIVRQALSNNRNVLSKELIDQVVDEKFNNPMLGIYTLHLLVHNKGNENEARIIVKNLRKLLVEPHPDVEAIALKLKMNSDYIFNIFPMLAFSWNYILEITLNKPEVVPKGSIANKNAGQFWSNDFWLIWGRNSKDSRGKLKKKVKRLVSLDILPNSLDAVLNMNVPHQEITNGLKNIFTNKPKDLENYKSLTHASYLSEQVSPIMQTFGLPRAKVEKILGKIGFELKKKSEKVSVDLGPNNIKTNDLKKGQWIVKSKSDSRKIIAVVRKSSLPNLYNVEVTVKSVDLNSPLTGVVKFHLSNSFFNPDPILKVNNGIAQLNLTQVSDGFTIRAESDHGKIILELDMTDLPVRVV